MPSKRTRPPLMRPTDPDTVRDAITRGLQTLAGVCDYARTRDDVGFNGSDAGRGHALADWSAQAPLTDLELIIGYRLLRKYERTQLAKAGIVLPDAATVSALYGPEIDIDRAKDRFAGAIRIAGDHLIVVFDYDPRKADRLKRCAWPFGGARFTRNPSGHGGYWTLPVAAVHAVAEAFPNFSRTADVEARLQQPAPVDVTPEPASASAPHGLSSVTRAAAVARPLGTISLSGSELSVRIEGLWDDRARALQAVSLCKAYVAQYGGAGYDPVSRCWCIHRRAALVITRAFPQFSISDAVVDLAAEQRHDVRSTA
jgi:hypothetical protein